MIGVTTCWSATQPQEPEFPSLVTAPERVRQSVSARGPPSASTKYRGSVALEPVAARPQSQGQGTGSRTSRKYLGFSDEAVSTPSRPESVNRRLKPIVSA